ncbi:PEP-CTERM sorting domain-containing protein [Nitrospira sp. Kam-Ns4a]
MFLLRVPSAASGLFVPGPVGGPGRAADNPRAHLVNPEPGTVLLLGTYTMGLAALRRAGRCLRQAQAGWLRSPSS